MAQPDPKDLMKRYVRWPLEAGVFWLWLAIFALLPVETASNVGGWLGRHVGPHLRLSRRATRNLRLAMPELSAEQRSRIVREMWDNLGRTAAEYAHLRTIGDPAEGRVECIGLENARATTSGQKPGVAFSAHFANWEVLHLVAAERSRRSASIVRDPNNPLVSQILTIRRSVHGGQLAPKGTNGARTALATLGANGLVAMLIDQRMSDGIAVPFFAHTAMTAPAAAQMAVRFDAHFFPVRLERIGPARFRMTVLPSLELPTEGSRAERIGTLMTQANAILEQWIREQPGQWLWLHRRWPKETYRELGL
ncbi:lysophospholipid acyltransferase family protein [Ferruginivarius sediminum]|uniref:Lauroyl acyltransferase n=1 Tax=Ferruginivarius sediminum TaxID=2661937 RepID=A0A369TBZ2_9PROT|nr:lauroyl acyltransferase [Ferruginivarius sediminum]RDD62362.1 lauroyl acyltransferase [Ferruginivarius sediminum]